MDTVKALRLELRRTATGANNSNTARVMSDALRDAGSDREADVWQAVAEYLDAVADRNRVTDPAVAEAGLYVVFALDRPKFVELYVGGRLLIEKRTGEVFAARVTGENSRGEARFGKGKRVAGSLAELTAKVKVATAAELARLAVEEFAEAVATGADLATLRAKLLAEIGRHTAALAG